MTDPVTHYAVQKFGAHARPRITGVYGGAGGWHPPADPDLRLTRDTAERLRAEGVTMVRVRWRLKTHEIIVRRYLGE
ncbi:hypothetical protein [Herbiconiux daphne]|uniref:Uncharacterized protein n=1 Tax=Herbiconiux daphne TaxID=2970914 RepID=A0ABT2H6N3_9MICO|nr:hypothetical protein [Herbiconiux daphne]MCS5735548.1 hypothetical protein [Herbiconiux daphne]